MKLSIVIPCYNEEAVMDALLARLGLAATLVPTSKPTACACGSVSVLPPHGSW